MGEWKDVDALLQKMVHKSKSSNVFLRGLREQVPFCFLQREFEKEILAKTSLEEANDLLRFYRCIDVGGLAGYVLKVIPASAIANEWLLFRPDLNLWSETLGEMTECDGVRLAQTSESMQQLDESARIAILDKLKRVGWSAKYRKFVANLLVDSRHEFYFEHPNDHVPGMMIIEAARQLLLASCHRFWNVPLEGARFVLSSLTSEFVQYVELGVPARLFIEFSNERKDKSGALSRFRVDVIVEQMARPCAYLSLETSVVSERLYARLRARGAKGPLGLVEA